MTSPRSMMWLFVAEFLFYVSGYIVHLGAGRILGPEDYGRYGLVITFTLLIANLLGNGIPVAMSKFLNEYRVADPGQMWYIKRVSGWLQFLVFSGIAILFFFAAPGFAALLGDATLAPLFRISAGIIPCFAADAFYFYFYSGIQKFAVQSTLKILRSLLRVIMILGLAYLYSVKGIVVGYIIVPLLVFLFSLAIDMFSSVGTLPQKSPTRSVLWETLIRFSIPVTSFLVLFEVLMSFDLYLIKYLFGSDVLSGQYNAALTIARIPTFLFYALTLILLPTISETFASRDYAKAKGVIAQASRFMMILTVFFFVITFVFAPIITTTLFGKSFAPAAVMLPTLMMSTGFLAMFYVLAFAYKGAGMVQIPLRLVSMSIVLDLFFSWLLIPRYGMTALPVAKFLAVLCLMPWFLYSLRRVFGVKINVFLGGKMLVAALIIFGLAHLVSSSVIAFLCAAPILFFVYGAVLFFFGVISRSDLAFLYPKAVKS